jgi:hypothetical protein
MSMKTRFSKQEPYRKGIYKIAVSIEMVFSVGNKYPTIQ